MRGSAARSFIYDDTVLRNSKPERVFRRKQTGSSLKNNVRKLNKTNTKEKTVPVVIKSPKIELTPEQIRIKKNNQFKDNMKLKVCFWSLFVVLLIVVPNVMLSGIGEMNFNKITEINSKTNSVDSDISEMENKLIILNSVSNVQAKAIAMGMIEISNKEILKPIQ